MQVQARAVRKITGISVVAGLSVQRPCLVSAVGSPSRHRVGGQGSLPDRTEVLVAEAVDLAFDARVQPHHSAEVASGGSIGSETRKVVPIPTSLLTSIRPPCFCTMP